jgi:hypothetical protein
MSRLHRRTHDIYGNSLNLNFKFIQLNRKWRLNIDTDTLKIEKYNTSTKTYDTKFNFT